MKIRIFLLTFVILAGVEVQAADPPSPKPWPPSSKPTLNGDVYDPPVYTSPTNDAPPASHFTNVITVPAITNWPATNFPSMTNWPPTNHLPAMTNPPALQPPGEK